MRFWSVLQLHKLQNKIIVYNESLFNKRLELIHHL